MRRPLARRGSAILALAVLLACLLHPAAVWAAEGTDATWGASVQRIANQSFDVLILRPTGMAALVVGFGLFVPAAIVTSPGGRTSISDAWDFFVVPPADYALMRPLGDF